MAALGPAAQAGPADGAGPASQGRRAGELLKRYEKLWERADPWASADPVKLRAAERSLLTTLERLPAPQLVALLGEGLSTRSVSLVLITLENAKRQSRWSNYEDALLMGMEALFEQPEKLEALADVTRRLEPSRDTAEGAARLLMKRRPAGRLAEHLGSFASRLEGKPRGEVKQFVVSQNLIEALGWLVDDRADVARLGAYLADPSTHDRARRALETASTAVASKELRLEIRRALDR